MSSPIGLDLGARTPEETAVSIAAEIIALRWGGGGGRLGELDGRIHGSVAHADPPPSPLPRAGLPLTRGRRGSPNPQPRTDSPADEPQLRPDAARISDIPNSACAAGHPGVG